MASGSNCGGPMVKMASSFGSEMRRMRRPVAEFFGRRRSSSGGGGVLRVVARKKGQMKWVGGDSFRSPSRAYLMGQVLESRRLAREPKGQVKDLQLWRQDFRDICAAGSVGDCVIVFQN